MKPKDSPGLTARLHFHTICTFQCKKNKQHVHKESLRNQHYDPQSCCAVQLCEFLVEGVWGKILETGATAIIWANIPNL